MKCRMMCHDVEHCREKNEKPRGRSKSQARREEDQLPRQNFANAVAKMIYVAVDVEKFPPV